MKNLLFSIIITAFTLTTVNAQQRGFGWRGATSEQRRELISKLSPEEKMNMVKQLHENMMVENLSIPEEKQEDFKKLFNEYQSAQREIKSQFKNDFDPDQLSDEEAKQKLEQSFNVGQQLLDNRKQYARKMQNILKPQQVLKMFQSEGMMRNKMMNRRMEMKQNAKPGFFRETPQQNERNNNKGMRTQQPK